MRTKKIPQNTKSATPEKAPKNEAKKRARKARPGNQAPQKTTSTKSGESVEAAPVIDTSKPVLGSSDTAISPAGSQVHTQSEAQSIPALGVSGESGPGDGPSPGARMGARASYCWFCGYQAPPPKGNARPRCPTHGSLRMKGLRVSYDGKQWGSNLHAMEQRLKKA